MNTEAMSTTGTNLQKLPQAPEQIQSSRKTAQEKPAQAQENNAKSTVQPEEILSKIKALTENGAYSVRFEKDPRTNQLVLKIVDSETQEVIRQVPAEEMLGLKEALSDLQGNIVNTVR
jgi:flagellar protein FlaG